MSEGIYAWLGVAPVDRKSHKAFFDQFQDRELKDNLAEGNLHVTTLYPSELGRAGLADWEATKLRRTASAILSSMGDLELVGTEFYIDPNKGVHGHKKWWTLEVEARSCDPFDDAREIAASVLQEIFGIQVANYSPEGYHISLTKRGDAGHDTLRSKKQPPITWVINSVGVEIGSLGLEVPYSTSYINNPLRAIR